MKVEKTSNADELGTETEEKSSLAPFQMRSATGRLLSFADEKVAQIKVRREQQRVSKPDRSRSGSPPEQKRSGPERSWNADELGTETEDSPFLVPSLMGWVRKPGSNGS